MPKQDVTIDLFYSGVWNDHTSDVLTRDEVEITHGRADESDQPAPTTAQLTFTGWDFNPRNPSSPLFGLIGRNTPLRIRFPASTRFVGEVSSWTPRQSLGGPNQEPDRWVEVVAAGVSRRLGQGADPLNDAMRREVEDNAAALVGYWPLDDVDGSTQARSVLRGGPMRLSTSPELASFQSLPAFGAGALHPWLPDGIQTRENGSLEGRVNGAVAGDFAVNFVYRATRASDGNIPLTTLVNAITNSVTGPQNFQVFLDPGLLPRIQIIDSDGSTIAVLEGDAHPEIFDGLPHLFRLLVNDTGPTVSVFLDLDGNSVIAEAVDIGQALDPLAKVTLFWEAAGIGVLPIRLGQVIAWNVPPTNMLEAFRGHAGEHAGRRIERLTTEEGVPFTPDPFDADLDDTQPCGPQYPDGLLELLREAADLDHGILGDSRVILERALTYRTGRDHYNRDPTGAGLDYDAGQVAPPLDPTLDDQATRNDITVKRRDGDSFRATLETGPMSTQTPPDGVGRVQESVTVNVMGDGLLGDQAGWRLHLGTTDEIRFPQVTVDLDANPELEVSASVLAPGDRLPIANLPPDLSPDPASLLVQGYTETIGSHRRRITFNCVPEEPYHIAEVEHADYAVIGSDSATVDSGIGPTATQVLLSLGAGPDWDHEGTDFDIVIGGERMTVTSAGSAFGAFPAKQQLISIVRSVNGVVKSHVDGAPVEFFHKSYIGL